jgi:ABC-type Na+ efflux pump permease subunit
MDMLIAWGVVLAAGLGALAGVFVWTRAIGSPIVRSLVRCLAAVWLLLPWSIQVVPGHYAPAFVVALFEGLFRDEGRAGPPLLALAAASLLVLAVFLLVSVVSRLRRRATSESV